ncbi:MAG: SH3 domain-containing protein [Caulobacteraceae bacterium]|nr:SH3 domain-containing protein [Caulobacteraceae bacterium]
MKKIIASVAVLATVVSAAAPTFAQDDRRRGSVQREQDRQVRQIPTCTRSLGTLSIVDGDEDAGWRQRNLAPPQKLLKVIVQRSGCFTLVDRGAGMNAAQAERDLANQGDLQRGSNMGRGQIRAADYVLVAEVAAQDSNASGSAAAAGLGGLIGGNVGAVVGGIRANRLEANTVLSLTSVRTSETLAVTEGYATKTDIGWGAGGGIGGWGGFGGAVGGGYEDTEIGRIVTQAFIDAYANMVNQLQGGNAIAGQGAEAPARSMSVTTATVMRTRPDDKASVVRALPVGLKLFPTGRREGMWWEVIDDNDNTGWVRNDKLSAAQ